MPHNDPLDLKDVPINFDITDGSEDHFSWKKLPSLTKYVVFSISFTIAYTITAIILCCFGIVLPDMLTKCVYGFFAGEVVVCGLVKIFKIGADFKDIKHSSYDDDTVG